MAEPKNRRASESKTSDSVEAGEKTLKKKKSITRLLSLSRRGSKSRASSPEFVTSSETPPAIPNDRVVSTGSIGAEPASGQLLNWNGGSALQHLDNNVSTSQQHHSSSTRDSTSTTNSYKAQNFSRHPRNRSGTNESYESTTTMHRDTLLPPPPTTTYDSQVSAARSLHHQKSHGAFTTQRDIDFSNGWADPNSSRMAPCRPSTAIADPRSVRGRDVPNFSSPRVTGHYPSGVDYTKPQPSPSADHQSFRSSRADDLRASKVSSTWSSSTNDGSVFTKKMSYVSDTTTEINEQEDSKDEMTVDDAIDLYSAGFDDDQATPTPVEPPLTAILDNTKALPVPSLVRSKSRHTQFFNQTASQSKSAQIAEAINEPLKPFAIPARSFRPNQPTSAAIFSGAVFRSIDPKPPGLSRPTKTHDQYGFRKYTRDVTIAQYDAWYNDYSKVESRRNLKWVEMMRGLGLSTREPTTFPPRSAKMQRYIRKGVPASWRGEVWFFYAGGEKVLHRNPDVYADLVLAIQKGKLSEGDKESIERDLHRTFPDNIHFKPEDATTTSQETPLLSALRRVLSAFAIHHPRIGYCQSLNFLAGFLLLFLSEEKAFWLLHIVTTEMLPGTHETSLEGANVDLWVLMLALEEALPVVWAKVGGKNQQIPSGLPPISLSMTSWFMSLFIGSLPVESTLRVWDALFYDGSVTIFRIALAIFRQGEAEIKAVQEQIETFQVVQTLPRRMLDIGSLMSTAYRKNTIQPAWVEKKRKERKAWYAEERQAERNRRDSKDMARPGENARDPAIPATIEEVEERGRPELPRNKSTGWFKRSQSMKRAQSSKRAATTKHNF